MTHGHQLRQLIRLLDGGLEEAYERAGLDFRSRYTPVIRALMVKEPATIGSISACAGLTQPAVTQTVALMRKSGIVSVDFCRADARQKMICLTQQGRDLIPQLERCWQAAAIASDSLDADLLFSLTEILDSALGALAEKNLVDRIREARAQLDKDDASNENRTVNASWTSN